MLLAALAVGLALIAVRAFVRLRGTTLAAPAVWAIVAAVTFALVEASLAMSGDGVPPLAASILRYAAAVGIFCPMMAVLGAKRPQDRGWQWIVLSLWIALLVPAGQAWLARGGISFTLPAMWRLLVFALLALGLLNYGPTSRGGSAVLFTLAQASLLSTWLFATEQYDASAIAALVILQVASIWPTRRDPPLTPVNLLSPVGAASRRWLNFRNGWGAFWALRILQRVNESAAALHWPVRLHWTGFAPTDAPTDAAADDAAISPEVAAQIDQTLDTLLRRFERLPPAPPSPI